MFKKHLFQAHKHGESGVREPHGPQTQFQQLFAFAILFHLYSGSLSVNSRASIS